MPITLNEIVRVRMYCNDLEQVSINTWYLQCATVGGLGVTYTDVANNLEGGLSPAMIAILNNNAVFKGIGVQSVNAPIILAEAFANAHAGVGASGPNALPRQTCGLIRLKDGRAGRSGRGRLYMPFPSTLDNAGGGAPTAGYVTRLGTVAALVANPFVVTVGPNSATMVPVLYHRLRVGPPIVPASSTPITTHLESTLWATQRRRGSYGRPNTSPI